MEYNGELQKIDRGGKKRKLKRIRYYFLMFQYFWSSLSTRIYSKIHASFVFKSMSALMRGYSWCIAVKRLC